MRDFNTPSIKPATTPQHASRGMLGIHRISKKLETPKSKRTSAVMESEMDMTSVDLSAEEELEMNLSDE